MWGKGQGISMSLAASEDVSGAQQCQVAERQVARAQHSICIMEEDVGTRDGVARGVASAAFEKWMIGYFGDHCCMRNAAHTSKGSTAPCSTGASTHAWTATRHAYTIAAPEQAASKAHRQQHLGKGWHVASDTVVA